MILEQLQILFLIMKAVLKQTFYFLQFTGN